MARHKMPQRTKRRLIAAGIAAATIIGTGVVIGVTGNALAWGRRSAQPDLSVLECIPDVTDPSASQSAPPPPASTTTTEPSGEVPPSETAPPEEPPTEQPPTEEPPAEQPPTEQPPAEQPPAEEPPAEETTAAERPDGFAQGQRMLDLAGRSAGQPPSETPGKPAPPPAPNGGAATAPDESGPPNPATPAPQPQAEDVKAFTKPSCTDALGPFPQDYVNILKVRPANLDARPQRGASRGTFTSRCGTNAGRAHSNSDNVIVAPGVVNGAHHTHDYVGNRDTSQASSNDSLAAAGTTCSNGDRSSYYWPVLRVRDRDGGGAPGEIAENPHNIGQIITASSASIQFRGSPTGKVVAMPRFLRIITGDAKASINGGANANVKWTCTGFTNRFTTKYPLCPRGSRVQIISDFQSCWDGQNIDSANHRTHVVFPDRSGACPAGFQAIPQLRITLTYDVPRGRIFAVDAFPEVQHNPITHHNDFINVMSDQLMQRAVTCINSGRNC